MNPNLFSDDLEFHYVVACRDGRWYVAADVENSVMSDGTIYDYGKQEWLFAYEDSPDEEIASIADLDTANYRVLNSALRQLNGEI
jgi:hypothetical protein